MATQGVAGKRRGTEGQGYGVRFWPYWIEYDRICGELLTVFCQALSLFTKEGPGYRVNKAMMLRMKKKQEEEEAERLLIGR